MGFEKGEGKFHPETDQEQCMWLTNRIAAEVRKAIFEELGYTASAGISNNKTVAKIACNYNKPNGQTIVPERYVKQALAQVPIKNMRWLGGMLGQRLRDAGLNTMGDIQPLDVENDIVPLVGYEKAQWIKDLSLGVCGEQVMEKKGPKSAGAIKTFQPVYSLENILKQTHLIAIDLILKIKEHMKDFDLFPTSIHVYQKQVVSYNDKDITTPVFKKTFKMLGYEDFKQDPNCLVEFIKAFFREHQSQLPFPARMCGATVQSFKPLSQVKLPSRKIDKIFSRPQDNAAKMRLIEMKERENALLNERVKEAKLAMNVSKKRVSAQSRGRSSKGEKRSRGAMKNQSSNVANNKLTAFFKPKQSQ